MKKISEKYRKIQVKQMSATYTMIKILIFRGIASTDSSCNLAECFHVVLIPCSRRAYQFITINPRQLLSILTLMVSRITRWLPFI